MHYLDYNEPVQHGTEDFPIAYYRVDEHHSRYNMPFHWHRELEIIRILDGTMRFYLDDTELIAQAGDVVFINEGVIHGGEPEQCVYECAVFDLAPLLMHTDTCRQYIRQISRHQIRVREHFTKEDRSFVRVAGHLFRALRKQAPGSELVTMGSLYELFGIIFQKQYYTAVENAGRSQRKMAALKPVLEYIDASYAGHITLEDLSRIAGMSPKYFCRYFQAVIHRTPVDYLNYYRIERACFLFSTTEDSVTDIAYRCGFNDSSYFVRTFKKYKGLTPKQYDIRCTAPQTGAGEKKNSLASAFLPDFS